jgi:hypothetical protein
MAIPAQPARAVPVQAGMETIARRYASGAAVLGLLGAISIWVVMGWGPFGLVLEVLPGVTLGFLATLVAARTAAAHLALSFSRASGEGAGLLGAAVAVGAMVIGTAAGAFLYFVKADWSAGVGDAAFDYLIAPVLTVGMFGLPPAAIIGLSSGILLRRALCRACRPSGIPPAL